MRGFNFAEGNLWLGEGCEGLSTPSTSLGRVHSFCYMCRVIDVTSQLPALAACPCISPDIMDSHSSGTVPGE